MKKALLIAAAVMFVASAASAVLPPVGYVGLFKDLTHFVGDPPGYPNPANTISSPCPLPGSYMFHGWLWILPSVNGAMAVQYMLVPPAGVMQLMATKNTFVGVEFGGHTTGMSSTFTACQLDWAWVYDFTFFVMVPPPLSVKIDLMPDPIVVPPRYLFANCDPGPPENPVETCNYLSPLYLCWMPGCPGCIAVQETNWGAIKSLF